jgi:GxxExxY protein
MDIEDFGKIIVDSIFSVHKVLGPGLLESAYQSCLAYELRKRGLKLECEVSLPLKYDGQVIDCGYRLDMLVEDSIVIENKSVEELLPLHTAQLLTYLKLSGKWLGYLVNWNTPLIKNGIHRLVNGPKPN